MEAFGTSVAASLLAVALLFVGGLVWCKLLRDVYLKLACRYVSSVKGSWQTAHKDEYEHAETIRLKQSGWRIVGTSDYVCKSEAAREIKKFNIEGILRNDILCGIYQNTDPRRKGCGTFSAKLSGDGMKLAGHLVMYDVEAEELKTQPFEWTRV